VKNDFQILVSKKYHRCYYYSLNIISLPRDDNEAEFVPKGPGSKKTAKKISMVPDLFSKNAGED